MTEVDILGVDEKYAFFNAWKLAFCRSWMRQYPISDGLWDPEENFEILNLKNPKNRLSGNASDSWKYSYL